jgi:HK97 family phage portal protein
MGSIVRLLQNRATWQSGGSPQNPQYWVKKLFSALETDAGIDIDADKALCYSSIWAAVNIIAGAVGFLPLLVYRRIDNEYAERAYGHRVYRLLHDRPNRYMDSVVFFETLQGHLLLRGNAYAEIERNGRGEAVALWPLLPHRTEPQVVNSRIRYRVTTKDGSTVFLPYDNVLHIKGLGFDGVKGYSVIDDKARNSIGTGAAAEKFAARFFKNDAAPRGVLEHPNELGDEAQKRLLANWDELHQGLDNKHRVAILEEGMKWQDTGTAPEQSQLLETRKFSVDDVARWFQIPPHMIANLGKATFNNIEHQGLSFVMYTLNRWLKRWELECNYKLFMPSEQLSHKYYTEFLTDALLRGDTKSRFAAYQVARQAGFMSINDIRRKENMNPVEGGDTYLEPLNMQPVGTRAGVRELIEQTFSRILTKETNALRKVAQKPDDFDARLEAFYDRHVEHVESVLGPVLRACSRSVTLTEPLDAIIDSYIDSHRSRLLSARAGNGGELAEHIEPILADWQHSEPIELSNRLLGGRTNVTS